jgi:hypothetical protein
MRLGIAAAESRVLLVEEKHETGKACSTLGNDDKCVLETLR